MSRYVYRKEDIIRYQHWQRNNNNRVLLYKARHRAKKKGLDFDLSLSDIIIPDICPILKIPLIKGIGKGDTSSSPTIDRIDSTKGYVKGNIQIISGKANVMKSNSTKKDLLLFANWIHDNYV